MAACGGLPPLSGRSTSTAFTDTAGTVLGRAAAERTAGHADESGIHPLRDAHDAFAARMLLARAAERSLDVQYYIWHGDLTGTLLFQALHEAAGRGVRVRLLLDDNNTSGLDAVLAALDAHPGIEVRLFNPFTHRDARWLGYLTDFFRLNRRMHNKSFTADNQATIVGGRNIGDEYFGAADGVLFSDLDVLAIGPVVNDVSGDFDRYWASGSSYPADRLLPAASPAQRDDLAGQAKRIEQSAEASSYVEAVRRSAFVERLTQGDLDLQWARTRMISDDPAKGLGQAAPDAMFPARLVPALGNPERELELVSPYFVPGEEGVAQLAETAKRGVKVRVLTNSLAATDVAAVHAGYAKRRKAMLEAGIGLYELRGSSTDEPGGGSGGSGGGSGSGSGGGSGGGSGSGSSSASLHAKTFAVDRERIFIGSFNFDPRSAKLNTELGFVIDSPLLAGEMAQAFDGAIPANAYEVRLDPESGSLVWIERRNGDVVRHESEPGTSLWQRLLVRFLSLLPIEWML